MKLYPSYLVGQNKGPHRSIVHKLLRILRQEINDTKGNSDMLLARREPDNPYDDKAVAIYLRDPDYKLGYLPQKHHWVADALDEGSEVLARIREIRREGLFSKKYYVDLELIPLRQYKSAKNKNAVKKAARMSRPRKDWPTFRITASVEEFDDVLIDSKGKLHSPSKWIAFNEVLKAKDGKNAVQRWARKHRRKLEKWWDENDRRELFERFEIYRLNTEAKEEKKPLSMNHEELEEFIEDGMDTSIEI